MNLYLVFDIDMTACPLVAVCESFEAAQRWPHGVIPEVKDVSTEQARRWLLRGSQQGEKHTLLVVETTPVASMPDWNAERFITRQPVDFKSFRV